jgi:hypothetical protein
MFVAIHKLKSMLNYLKELKITFINIVYKRELRLHQLRVGQCRVKVEKEKLLGIYLSRNIPKLKKIKIKFDNLTFSFAFY